MYSIKREDGKTSTVVESQYFDLAKKFTNAHNELKNDFDLRLAMSGMSTDLALIDTTHGKNFTDGNEKMRASLLEDYSTLRARLDNPETPPEERQLISDYFDTMSGDALSFLESSYDLSLANDKQSKEQENDDTKEQVGQILAESKERLEKIKSVFSECSSSFDSALAHIDELVGSRSTDLDDLQLSLTRLLQAQKSLAHSVGKFNSANADYLTDVVQNEEQIDNNIYRQEFDSIKENNEQIQSASRKIHNVDGHIVHLRTYIHGVESLTTEMRKF